MKKLLISILFFMIFIPFYVNAESKYLYDVLKNEAESGGLAKEYTGQHHDSFTEEPTHKIYYWDERSDVNLANISSVYFGNYCWQMVRTTDTGGVKLIYNGEAKDKYSITPYESNQYTITNNNNFVWDGNDKSWNQRIKSNYGGSIYIKPLKEEEYIANIEVNPSDSFNNGYIYFYKNHQSMMGNVIISGKEKQSVQYDFGVVSPSDILGFSYSGGNSSSVDLDIKITIGKKDSIIGKTCYNYEGNTRIIGKSKFNNISNAIGYVGYMYNPESLITYKNYYNLETGLFGSDVSYSNGKYKLLNTSSTRDDEHHYSCLNDTDTCEKVAFFHYRYHYVELDNGLKIEDAIKNMLSSDNVNRVDSTIKKYIENWYEENMLDYTPYLEDTIFCNNRFVTDYGGWNKNGHFDDYIYFRDYNNNKDLSCPNVTDRFSITNSKAKLRYPVGLMTRPEYDLLNVTDFIYYTSEWLLTPSRIQDSYIVAEGTRHNGNSNYSNLITREQDIRPVISLLPGIQYRYGNGTRGNPYYIKILNNSNIHINDSKNSVYVDSYNDVKEDSNVIIYTTPVDGYKIIKLEIRDSNNNEINYNSKDGNYSFTMSDSDVTITPIYEKVKNSVNVEVVDETKDLNINIEDFTQVEYEEEVTFKVTPIKGYQVNGIKIIDEDNHEIEYSETGNKNEYTFVMPSSDVTIIPSYERVKNSVEVEENTHMKVIVIEVEDAKAVVYEDTVKFTITPEEGYEVDTIEIKDKEGNKIEYKKTNKENEYEFVMPDTDVTITPIYKRMENTITNPETGNIKVFILGIIGIIVLVLYQMKRKKRFS